MKKYPYQLYMTTAFILIFLVSASYMIIAFAVRSPVFGLVMLLVLALECLMFYMGKKSLFGIICIVSLEIVGDEMIVSTKNGRYLYKTAECREIRFEKNYVTLIFPNKRLYYIWNASQKENDEILLLLTPSRLPETRFRSQSDV